MIDDEGAAGLEFNEDFDQPIGLRVLWADEEAALVAAVAVVDLDSGARVDRVLHGVESIGVGDVVLVS